MLAVAAAAPAHAKAAPKQEVPSQAERRAEAEAQRRELKQAIERMNQQAIKDGRKLNFAMDEVTDQMVITVRKAESGEVIRQIPSEAVLRVAHNMEQLKGLVHDKNS
jgi:flagellar protein FlaG